MNGSCSTHGEDKKCMKIFFMETLEESDHSENLDVDGKIIL
jgi:hypothetical protein